MLASAQKNLWRETPPWRLTDHVLCGPGAVLPGWSAIVSNRF